MNLEVNTPFWWLIVIVVVIFALIVYFRVYHRVNFGKSIKGIIKHYQRYLKIQGNHIFPPSAKTVKETIWLIMSILIGLLIIFYICEVKNTPDIIKEFINAVDNNFINKFPLLATIIGAFIALLCDYLFIHPTLFVRPDAFFFLDKVENEERLGWYIGNLTLFDCIDIHVDAYECIIKNEMGDLLMKNILLKNSDVAVLAGCLAKNNDRAMIVSTNQLQRDKLKTREIDHIEIYVKVTHALSRVTKTIIKQYRLEDIYDGDINGELDSLCAVKNQSVIITSLKTQMLNNFIGSRRFCTISIFMMLIATFIAKVFPQFILVANGVTSAVVVAFAISTIIFALFRYYYHFQVATDPNDEYKLYRTYQFDK